MPRPSEPDVWFIHWTEANKIAESSKGLFEMLEQASKPSPPPVSRRQVAGPYTARDAVTARQILNKTNPRVVDSFIAPDNSPPPVKVAAYGAPR